MKSIYDKKQTQIQRKCGCCKKNIYINNENIDDAIYYDKKTYHSKCFINICNKRSKMKNQNISQKWMCILNDLDNIKQKSYEHLSLAVMKENIFDFIKDAYNVTIIPTTVWRKLDAIYSGTYKGMTNGIPPEHLLDMWKRKINMLNGIANSNSTNGKVMDSSQRINYDLSILINKYDSYLKWLEKQKIFEAEKEVSRTENIISKNVRHINQNEDTYDFFDDISSLVDDIFG